MKQDNMIKYQDVNWDINWELAKELKNMLGSDMFIVSLLHYFSDDANKFLEEINRDGLEMSVNEFFLKYGRPVYELLN